MLRNRVAPLALLLAASPLAAQVNPFAFTGGSVKTAYIVYDIVSEQPQTQGATFELGVAPDRWIMRTVTPFEVAGKKDTMRVLAVTTRDSQYTVSAMGGQRDGEAGPLMRPHLAREYAALSSAAKARFRENLRLAVQTGGSSDVEQYITLLGDKAGSETVAGHKCDVYKTKKATACVLPQAPGVMLRWANNEDKVNLVAKKVTINGPIPPALSVLPKGLKWKPKEADDADFLMNVWALKKQAEPEGVSPAAVTKFAVGYLASAEATTELRAMTDQSGDSEDAPDDEAEANESGS
jgi:hypothetical protein